MLPAATPIGISTTQNCLDASDAQAHCPAASSLSPSSPLPSNVAGVCSCTLLFFPPVPLLAMDDSPPDSPSMPWRPGSSAYPPPAPLLSPSSDDSTPSHRQQSKRDLQKLYDALSEASYDLSLRDIVEPPFTIDGSSACSTSLLQAEAEPTPDQLVPIGACDGYKETPYRHQKQQLQNRSLSCRKSDSSKYLIPRSPKCKLAFSFSYPQRAMVYGHSSPSSPSQAVHLQSKSSPAHENSPRNTPLPSLEHVLTMPHELPALPSQRATHLDTPSSSLVSKKPSFKRSSTSIHHTALKSNNVHGERRGELNIRGTLSVAGLSNRIHPSSQCSSCSSYTIFFKSHCRVCGKLYCSNCAKDEMDSASDGRRCKRTCNSRLGSKRFSRSVRSKCWPLCCNIDVSNNPNKCKASC